ncbi:uracil-DNA glycosylase family protein [Aggregatimonas sangjinii]|uniref:Uracil-DNA glycosylase family protein n=1 Tax=Aggregatimonas sangjinii TaxID=2583587 RepID=A0A5B7SZK1_9FLAO|nr:uracil-DNA glycosylase family protein [Aggregatimonas sangjinii]QCX02264.1 uracil-DNA glycosylase family protein [Aggregatimonas sangjinii]
MFLHTHPYQPFLFKEATKLIVGTLPPPRFTTGDLKEDDVNFCYGSRDGQLWPILDRIFELGLRYDNSKDAIQQRQEFLVERKIGICDIVESAERDKIDASDLGMQRIKLRNLVGFLQKYQRVKTLLFTGGNSKNGPEYFFRRHLKEHQVTLKVINNKVPRIHEFELPREIGQGDPSNGEATVQLQGRSNLTSRKITTVSLTAPSGAANRAVGSMEAYKRMKDQNPDFNTLDFRVLQYKEFF